MIGFLKKWKTPTLKQVKETGNVVVFYVIMFPIFFGAFGLAVDTTVATYTRSSLQSNLDAATQSALSRAFNPGIGGNTTSNPKVIAATAKTDTLDVYDTNRAPAGEQPFVTCQTSPTIVEGVSGSPSLIKPTKTNCGFTLYSFNLSSSGRNAVIEATVVEKSKTLFLTYLGFPEFTYVIKSEARITYGTGG